MNIIAVHDYFGYEIPMNERYRLISEAGFDGVMLGWAGFPDNPDETKHQNPELARKNGLYIVNLHTPFAGANNFWMDNADGDDYFNKQLTCISDCVQYDIPVMVLHINQGLNPPPISEIGIERLRRLVCKAEDSDVYLAFENMRSTMHLRYILNNIQSKCVKFCYDSGHQHCKTPNEDLLTEFGDKLITLHLHDNNGMEDDHKIPFDGTISWTDIMQKIKNSGYAGAISIEVVNSGYENLHPSEFLEISYKRAQILQKLVA